MAANNGNRFCQNCGGVWHQNHGRVCPVLIAQRQQRQPPAQQQAPQAPRANGGEEIQDLIRRVRLLESVRTMVPPSGAVVEDMRFPAPGQPRGSVNRVFTLYLGLLPSANTSGIVYVPMPRAVGVTSGSPEFLDVAPTMPGFSEWAQGYGEVSISAVAVTYTPTAAGMVGSSFVSIGVGRADRSVSDASTVNTMERTVSMGWSTAGQLRTVYTPGGAFDRHLLGGRQNRQSRPWARVYVVRSSTAFVVPSGPTVNYTQSLGMLRLSIQCACMREEV